MRWSPWVGCSWPSSILTVGASHYCGADLLWTLTTFPASVFEQKPKLRSRTSLCYPAFTRLTFYSPSPTAPNMTPALTMLPTEQESLGSNSSCRVVDAITEEQERQQEAPGDVGIPLLESASAEIEQMRNNGHQCFHSFPPSCLSLLKRLQGNHRCVDCGEQNPQWAACRYGALLCLNCSGHHRSLGVQVSSVRSISMDEWSVTEVVSMLEGGNHQIGNFFERHNLTRDTCHATTTSSGSSEHETNNGGGGAATMVEQHQPPK